MIRDDWSSDQAPSCSGDQGPPDLDLRALQVELRAARQQLVERDASLARLVEHLQDLQRTADAATSSQSRADALEAQLAAVYASRTFRLGVAAHQAVSRLPSWLRRR